MLHHRPTRCPRLGPQVPRCQQARLQGALSVRPGRIRDPTIARVQRPKDVPRGPPEGARRHRQPGSSLLLVRVRQEVVEGKELTKFGPAPFLPSPSLFPSLLRPFSTSLYPFRQTFHPCFLGGKKTTGNVAYWQSRASFATGHRVSIGPMCRSVRLPVPVHIQERSILRLFTLLDAMLRTLDPE